MIIMLTTSYPPESAKQVGKRFLEFPPMQDYNKLTDPYIKTIVGEGIKSIAIYEFDDSKYTEASAFLHERAAALVGVPGLTYSLEPWLEPQDALEFAGLDG